MPAQSLCTTQADLADSISELLLRVVQALVDDTARVAVAVIPKEEGILLLLRVAPDDLLRVHGPDGRTKRSLKTIVQAATMKTQQRFLLEIRAAD